MRDSEGGSQEEEGPRPLTARIASPVRSGPSAGVAHGNQLSAWNGSLHDWIVGRPTGHVRRAWKASFRCPLGIWDRRLLPLVCAGLGLDWMDGLIVSCLCVIQLVTRQ
jgi:hypothetical protein